MTSIKILSEILSNKIAAGEVVERPASVVKELIENALDAGSTRVNIEVEQGGKSLIRVSDNGSGMEHDDALLALERYATSKISKDEDLMSIQTLGFRGEALPSIFSVSRFSLVTRPEDADTGTEIVGEGGKIKQVVETGSPAGTMITVRQLFYNIPARRKFLKTENTEMGRVADIVSCIALGHPNVRFRLSHNEKLVKDWPGAENTADRAADVFGRDIKNSLHEVLYQDHGISVAGWISSPRVTRSTARGIYLYVNGRFVRDRVIQHGLLEGYSGRLMKGQFPVAVLFVDVSPDRVDVNVHPAKQEVRFSDSNRVHGAVKQTVTEALRQSDRSKWAEKKLMDHKATIISEPVSTFEDRPVNVPDRNEAVVETDKQVPASGPEIVQAPIWEKKQFEDLRIIGQFRNTYILCESEEGLILVDQHAAHERILYEQLKQKSDAEKKSVQRLLIPETVDLGYQEANMLEKMIPELAGLGFEIEPFGGNTFAVKAVPAILGNREITPLIIELAEKIVETGFSAGLDKLIDECIMLMACHGAIRANLSLSDEQIRNLLKQMDACDNPSNCPHGRPTWIKWSTRFLEKSFNRVI